MTGAWRIGDPPGRRQFLPLGTVALESGSEIPDVVVAYETLGSPRVVNGTVANAVLVLHALTGDAHVAGPAGPGQPTPGWWDGLIGPGKALDTDDWYVVSPNVLGGCQGTTGPSSPDPDGRAWGSRFPRITVRDQVAAERRFSQLLGIQHWAGVLGGSMGGMRVLEWAVSAPEQVGCAVTLAVGAAASADQIGTQSAQLASIVNDQFWYGGDYYDRAESPVVGMGIARQIAHLTYRTDEELERRFGHSRDEDGVFAVQSYLRHHGDKLSGRFDPGSYVVLTDAMNTHDLGRGRGGVATALAGIEVPLIVGGIDSDRLYPLRQQYEIAAAVPGCDGVDVISSRYGHDGFLLETEAVGKLVRRALESARR
jgi:homoserine O-acetyltransferase/O-succinyltransferase